MLPTFRHLPNPDDVFPRRALARKPNRFRASYKATLDLLDVELDHLDAREAWLQVALIGGESSIRLDGMLRSDAKASHPGVVLTAVTDELGTLVYPCDSFESRWSHDPEPWKVNLRAIALGLEHLRRLDDYGLGRGGEQYAGYRALGSGTAQGGELHDAASLRAFLHRAAFDADPPAGWPFDPGDLAAAFRVAARRCHPDRPGGSTAMMAALNRTREALGVV